MLVFSHGKLKEAGLDGEESLLDLANTLHRMTVELAASATASDFDLQDALKYGPCTSR